MSAVPGYKKCFFCSHDEPTGVNLMMQYQDGTVTSDFALDRRFQGFEGIVHGGILTGILDELMWWTVAVKTGKASMTRKMEVDLLRPVKVETTYRAKGALLKQEGNTFSVSGTITDTTGLLVAKGTGTFKLAKGVVLRDLIDDFDFTNVSPELRAIFLSDL